jgi:hypothetical protein
MKLPTGWRKGQFYFNFLEWLNMEKGYDNEQSPRMADPFHISDDKWDQLLEEFEKQMREEGNYKKVK